MGLDKWSRSPRKRYDKSNIITSYYVKKNKKMVQVNTNFTKDQTNDCDRFYEIFIDDKYKILVNN